MNQKKNTGFLSPVFGVLFCTAGILFALGKCHIHLAAWKQIPEDEKSKIRIHPLCQNIGGMIVLCGIIFLLGGIWSAFQAHAFVWAMILWMIASEIDVYYIGKSKRYIR